MDSTTPSIEWLNVVRRAVATTDGSRAAVSDAIRSGLRAAPTAIPLAAAFAEALAELTQYATAPVGEATDAVDVENAAVLAARRILRPLLQAKLQGRLDALDGQPAGQTRCPTCQKSAESQGRLARDWTSLFGDLELRRRYRYCADCDAGFAPAQQALGLPTGDFTPRFEEACTLMTTTVSHGMAQQLLGKLLGVEVSLHALEDMTERRGAAVLAHEAAAAQRCAPYDPTGLPLPAPVLPAERVPETAVPRAAYLETDGVSALTRQELTGDALTAADKRRQRRARQQHAHGGKGRRYRTLGKEVKNAVLYDGHDCAKESPSRGCLLHKTYVSYLGEWQTFATWLWTAMLRLRFDQVQLLVVLSDGAEWIRSLAAWLPIPTFLILDLYHVKRRLWEVAHSLYGEHTPEADQWAQVQGERVEAGRVQEVITALGFLHPARAETTKLVADLAGWLTNNRDRTDYPTYRARGLRISSAAIESANFHVTGQRLKVQGTRWSEEGARQMAALRADLFNGHWERRTKQLLAA
jgi:Uncharacterised protein family (UPF0236)